MKRLFLSVFVLTLGAFTFISCNDDDKVKGDERDGGKYMTVPEQQQAITNVLDGVAEAIEFTEFSHAIEFVEGFMEKEIDKTDLLLALASPAVQTDSLFQYKLLQAMTMFYKDSIALDLTPFYMSADMFVRDTMIIDTIRYIGEGGSTGTEIDTIYKTLFTLDNVNHNVDYLQLRVFVNSHELVAKAKVKAGESIIIVKNHDALKTVFLPESAEVSIILDGKNLASFNGQYSSDMSLYYENVEDGDDIIEFDGKQFSVSGNLKVVSYELSGGLKFEMSKGAEANMSLKYANNELLKADANLAADFTDFDVNDDGVMLAWAQNPEKLKSINLNASLGAGKIELKGTMDNPFKDEALAATLRTLMVPDATISEQKAKEAVEGLNKILNVGLYFEGYKEAQAKLKLVYMGQEAAGTKGDVEEDNSDNPLAMVRELFAKTGAYPVIVAHDENGKEIEVPIQEYFGKIDFNSFVQTVFGKFQEAFAPILAKIKSSKEEQIVVEDGGYM